MHHLKKAAIGAAAAALIVGYIASPYFTLHKLRSAIEAGDAEEVVSHVDFPALKENIKSTFTTQLMNNPHASPSAAVGAGLAMAFVGPAVDQMVSPANLERLLKDFKPKPETRRHAADIAQQPQPLELDTANGYQDLNTFSVKLQDKGNPDNHIIFIFKRSGLFTWKLSEVELPTAA